MAPRRRWLRGPSGRCRAWSTGTCADEGLGDARGPFDDAGHAQAAFPERALFAAQIAGGLRPFVAAVVAAIPEQRVVGDLQLAQRRAQPADAAIDGGDLAVVVLVLLRQRAVGRLVRRQRLVRHVRGAKPHDRQERLARGGLLADELQASSVVTSEPSP